MTSKELSSQPTSEFANDYNTLRTLVLEAQPDLEIILPPAVAFEEVWEGSYSPVTRYAEIKSYCQQIANLLN